MKTQLSKIITEVSASYGIAEVDAKALEELLKAELSKAYEAGHSDGYDDGYESGYADCHAKNSYAV